MCALHGGAIAPVLVRTDVPEADEDDECLEKIASAQPLAMACYLRDDSARMVLDASFLKLVEVLDVSEREVVLEHPEGNHSVALEVMPDKWLGRWANLELAVQSSHKVSEVLPVLG